MAKTFFRCRVCGDIHFGIAGPVICPNCQTKNAYDPIEKDAAKKSMGF
jgi:rubrerythrin